MPGSNADGKRRSRIRTRSRWRLGVPALVAAISLGLVTTAVVAVGASADPGGGSRGGSVGGVGGVADDLLASELAARARAVSDPYSPQYRHFLTPAQVAKYLVPGTWKQPKPRSAPGGSTGDLMRSQRVDANSVLAALDIGGAAVPAGPPRPCSAYFGQITASNYPSAFGTHPPFAVCGYTPAQLRSAYDTDTATGRGVTVAVLGAYGSPTILADANEYAARHDDLPFLTGQYTQKVEPKAWTLKDICGGVGSWAAEQALDVEAVHALAPDAHVLYYGANSCQDSDLLAALTDVVAHHLADVVTASWGGPVRSIGGDMSADVIQRYDRLFQVAALEGISVDFPSGDCGVNAPSSRCGGATGLGSTRPQTSFPAEDPWVTGVGGTSIEVGHDGSIRRQTAWGTRAWKLAGAGWESMGWIYGGGGGASELFAEPWYQACQVSATLAGTLLTGAPATTPRRTVPDVALDADPFTGMLVGQTRLLADRSGKSGSSGMNTRTKVGYAESAAGGTSLASPLFAALEADAIQLGGGLPLGFVNPTLYARARTPLLTDVAAAPRHLPPKSQVFPPIPGKPAVLAGLGDDGPLLAMPGYDTATGLGTPSEDFAERLTELGSRRDAGSAGSAGSRDIPCSAVPGSS
jgi:hypothetical protein